MRLISIQALISGSIASFQTSTELPDDQIRATGAVREQSDGHAPAECRTFSGAHARRLVYADLTSTARALWTSANEPVLDPGERAQCDVAASSPSVLRSSSCEVRQRRASLKPSPSSVHLSHLATRISPWPPQAQLSLRRIWIGMVRQRKKRLLRVKVLLRGLGKSL